MFHSNQILQISGDKKDQLISAIKYICDFDDRKISTIVAFKEVDIKGVKELRFGWIPRDKTTGKYDDRWAKDWDTIIPDAIPINETILCEIITNWLNQKQQLDRAKEIRKNDSLDNPCNGFLISALSDWDAPTFSVFSVKVFVCEYCD